MKASVSLLTLLFGLCVIDTAQAERRSLKMAGVTEHFDVRYLPDWRYTGDAGERGDIRMTLDLYVPAVEPPDDGFPLVMYVHGGAYVGGSKHLGRGNQQLARRMLEEGIAFASLNYVLRPKGVFPQVWWDYRDAVRFLRINADDYRIDPLRFGAYGLSAGGWLITTANAGNGSLVRTDHNQRSISISELKDQKWVNSFKGENPDTAWLRPIRNPKPAWPGVNANVSAIAYDFSHHMSKTQPYNPVYQQWVGRGYQPKPGKSFGKATLEYAFLTHKRYAGRGTHVPPFFGDWKKGESRTLDADGKEVHLGEVVIDFFKRQLAPGHRLPVPEVHPAPHMITGPTEITIVAPPGSQAHYTTDGSEPNADSPVFNRPFVIDSDTTIRTIAIKSGHESSGINTAPFIECDQPPARVTAPDELPTGKTGEPYEITFKSDSSNARWLVQGDLSPHMPRNELNPIYPNNMAMDADSGKWSGTPFKPGVYWVQVWVNNGPGTLATHRNYRWTVTGELKAGQDWQTAAANLDTNVEVARLKGEVWRTQKSYWLKPFIVQLNSAGIRFVIVDEDDEDQTLIVPKADAARTRKLLETYVDGSRKLKPQDVIYLYQD